MAEPVRHRQTKGAATDMFDLQQPRHTSTLPTRAIGPCQSDIRLVSTIQCIQCAVVACEQSVPPVSAIDRWVDLI
jgi:hypothetical protein